MLTLLMYRSTFPSSIFFFFSTSFFFGDFIETVSLFPFPCSPILSYVRFFSSIFLLRVSIWMLMMSLHGSYVVTICCICFFCVFHTLCAPFGLHQFHTYRVAFLLVYSIFEFMYGCCVWACADGHHFFKKKNKFFSRLVCDFLCKSSFKMFLCTHTMDVRRLQSRRRKKLFYKKETAKMRIIRMKGARPYEVVRWCVRCDGLNIIFDLFRFLFLLTIVDAMYSCYSRPLASCSLWRFVFRARVLSLNTISTKFRVHFFFSFAFGCFLV